MQFEADAFAEHFAQVKPQGNYEYWGCEGGSSEEEVETVTLAKGEPKIAKHLDHHHQNWSDIFYG